MTKAELRKIYFAKQKDLSTDEMTEKSKQIANRLFQNFDPTSIKTLHCFIAIDRFNEIDTTIIFQTLWREHPCITVVVPRVDFKKAEMQNLKFGPETTLVKNVWGIHEPSHDEYIATEKIDIVLVPLLCFDRVGNRVGYGKGFYDRFLAECRSDCAKVGLSYFPPVDAVEDAGPHDVRLDRCVTPDKTFDFKQTG